MNDAHDFQISKPLGFNEVSQSCLAVRYPKRNQKRSSDDGSHRQAVIDLESRD
jgi:hypothetical protein